MAKALRVGQVAEWFKATVLKTSQGQRLKAPNSRISNSYRPRITRTERTSQRFAMAHMSAHNKSGRTTVGAAPCPYQYAKELRNG